MTKKEINKTTHTTFNMDCNNKAKVIEMAANEHIHFTAMLNKIIDAGLTAMDDSSSNGLSKAFVSNLFNRSNDELQKCLGLINSMYIYLAMSINKVPPIDFINQARVYLERFDLDELPIDSVTRLLGGDASE